MKKARLIVSLSACGACLSTPTEQPDTPAGGDVFSGEFTLVAADDWVDQQRCNYVIPTDEMVCSWGSLSVTKDHIAVSVRGFDVHLGTVTGPLIHRDSVMYTIPIRVLDHCTVAIDSTAVAPNGLGLLAADTLRFRGINSIGDSLTWVYRGDQVQNPSPCP